MLVTNLKSLVNTDLDTVDKLIETSLQPEISLVRDVGMHIIRSGGKRLRPLLVLLSAKSCGYAGSDHITLAAVIEFIHTATLLHDDVVDCSDLRRGLATANKIWGNDAAILVGDFLYSRAFQLMVRVENNNIMRIIADATNTMATGEAIQLLHQNKNEINESNYLRVIRSKTAKLFEAAAEIGAVLADAPLHIKSSMAQFGLHIGTAYQLIDDVLDYQANTTEFGKQIGKDFAEGKLTMPLIYLLQNGSATQKQLILELLKSNRPGDLLTVQQLVQTSGALKYSLDFAHREIAIAKQVISELPESEYRSAAFELADFVVQRGY